jgi:predicted nucleic acid-binding protein
MKPVVIDTNIWVDWFRGAAGTPVVSRDAIRGRVVFMPAVVGLELLSGARDRKSFRMVSDLIDTFSRNSRFVLPDDKDYRAAGSALAELGWSASKKTGDALVVACARKIGAEIWTRDFADLTPLAEYFSVSLIH